MQTPAQDAAPTVIFFDREDVLNLPTSQRRSAAIALSPSALFAAQEAGIDLQTTKDSFSNNSHESCVRATSRALADFDGSKWAARLPPSVALMARQALWGHAALVFRLEETLSLTKGPWLAKSVSGEWQQSRDLASLQGTLLPRIWGYGQAHLLQGAPPPLTGFYMALHKLLVTLGTTGKGSWVATSSPKLKNGLRQALARIGGKIAVFQPTLGDWGDYVRLFKEARNRGPVRAFFIVPFGIRGRRVDEVLQCLAKVGEVIHDENVRSAWQLYQPFFLRAIPAMMAITAKAPITMRKLGMRAAVGYEANAWTSAALLQAAGIAGMKRVVFNHNSNPPSESALARPVLETLFTQRTSNPLVDVAALWSPASLKWPRPPATIPFDVRLRYPLASSRKPGGPLRILHAGNYQNWSDFFPWIAETADEYINGLCALADAVEQLEGIELTIRVRPKREVDQGVVLARLGKRRHVVVCGVEQEFLEQLAGHDLLVAHFSTTIEQALQMGKPVLQWGSADRYEQFQGQANPPSDALNDRIYTTRSKELLQAMLSGIRDAIDRPRREGDNAHPYGFDMNTQTVDDLARYLIAPDAPQPLSRKQSS